MEKSSPKIANVAFYRFVEISDPQSLKQALKAHGVRLGLKGTILLASEGINAMLAGPGEALAELTDWLQKDPRFSPLLLKWSYSDFIPFRRLMVKVKKEILTLRRPEIDPRRETAPFIKPGELETLLKSGRPLTLIDVRNHFEVGYGTFKGALDPKTKSFGEFPRFVRENLNLPKEETIVTFCTGGIRCEKASGLLLEAGYKNVFQLEGGILEYLARTSGDFFEGRCFVFDEREALDKNLSPLHQNSVKIGAGELKNGE